MLFLLLVNDWFKFSINSLAAHAAILIEIVFSDSLSLTNHKRKAGRKIITASKIIFGRSDVAKDWLCVFIAAVGFGLVADASSYSIEKELKA